MHSKCTYAESIGRLPYFIEREDGVDVCGFCHVPKNEQPKSSAAKTVRK
jgi:hypothetical protein